MKTLLFMVFLQMVAVFSSPIVIQKKNIVQPVTRPVNENGNILVNPLKNSYDSDDAYKNQAINPSGNAAIGSSNIVPVDDQDTLPSIFNGNGNGKPLDSYSQPIYHAPSIPTEAELRQKNQQTQFSNQQGLPLENSPNSPVFNTKYRQTIAPNNNEQNNKQTQIFIIQETDQNTKYPSQTNTANSPSLQTGVLNQQTYNQQAQLQQNNQVQRYSANSPTFPLQSLNSNGQSNQQIYRQQQNTQQNLQEQRYPIEINSNRPSNGIRQQPTYQQVYFQQNKEAERPVEVYKYFFTIPPSQNAENAYQQKEVNRPQFVETQYQQHQKPQIQQVYQKTSPYQYSYNTQYSNNWAYNYNYNHQYQTGFNTRNVIQSPSNIERQYVIAPSRDVPSRTGDDIQSLIQFIEPIVKDI